MDFDETRLAEIEQNERWLAGQMTPPPTHEAIAYVRDAVHVAIEEQWLLEACSPAADLPARDVVERIKAGVRAALVRRRRARRYRVFAAVTAAAAVIALAVGAFLYRYHSVPTPTVQPPVLALADKFEAAWNAIETDDTFSDVVADLAWIDAQMGDGAAAATPRADELELEYLQDRIDGLFSEPDYPFETS